MKYIFGHRPSMDPTEFSTLDRALNYLRNELPNQEAFRYRTTYNLRQVDSIIFSFDGELLAELVVGGETSPTDQDEKDYSKARKVYLIDEVRIFRERTRRAADFGLTPSQFGTKVPEEAYAQLIEKVGGFEQIIKKQ